MSHRFVVPRYRAPRRITSAAPRFRCQASPLQSMKIEGASRRSAAPGSQNVGVAEYGDDPCPQSRLATTGAPACRPQTAVVLPPAATVYPSHPCFPATKHHPAAREVPCSVGASSHTRPSPSKSRSSQTALFFARTHSSHGRAFGHARQNHLPMCRYASSTKDGG
jgi:hypothetical protein